MVNYVYQSGKPVYGLRHYVVDTATEINKLPVNCAIGSTATVIATGDEYIMNSEKQWIKQPVKGSSGSGSGEGSGGTSGFDDAYHEIVILDDNSPSEDNHRIIALNEV